MRLWSNPRRASRWDCSGWKTWNYISIYFFHGNVETLLCQSAAFHYGPSLMSHSLSISGSHLSGPLLLTNLNPAHIQSKLQELHATKWFSESCNSIVDMFLPRRKSERAWNHEVPVGSCGICGLFCSGSVLQMFGFWSWVVLRGTTPHDLAMDSNDKKVMGLQEPVPCQNRVQ